MLHLVYAGLVEIRTHEAARTTRGRSLRPLPDRRSQAWSHTGCEEEYFPYGKSSDRRDERNRYRYIGVERDEATGLLMTGPRLFSPEVGRFLQCDPIGASLDRSPYEYSLCRPLLLQDSSGLAPEEMSSREAFIDANSSGPLTKHRAEALADEIESLSHGHEWMAEALFQYYAETPIYDYDSRPSQNKAMKREREKWSGKEEPEAAAMTTVHKALGRQVTYLNQAVGRIALYGASVMLHEFRHAVAPSTVKNLNAEEGKGYATEVWLLTRAGHNGRLFEESTSLFGSKEDQAGQRLADIEDVRSSGFGASAEFEKHYGGNLGLLVFLDDVSTNGDYTPDHTMDYILSTAGLEGLSPEEAEKLLQEAVLTPKEDWSDELSSLFDVFSARGPAGGDTFGSQYSQRFVQ
jgi:RHS repeat-associated protein